MFVPWKEEDRTAAITGGRRIDIGNEACLRRSYGTAMVAEQGQVAFRISLSKFRF